MLAHLKKWNRWFLHPSLYPDLDVEKREIREFIMALSFFVLVLYLSKVQNQVTCCYAFMLPVSCPTNAIVYKASGKFLYIPCINILKRYRLEMFFYLVGKVKWNIWILECSDLVKCLQMIFVCRDEVLANAHSWHRHEYCYPCGKVKSKIINIACCSNVLPFVCWLTFFNFKF